MKICVRHRANGQSPWQAVVVDHEELPAIGQLIALGPKQLYKVLLAIHTCFDTTFDAEVFVEAVNLVQVQSETIGAPFWT